MASKEQSVTLLRRNKRATVEGLQSNNFAVDESLRMSDVPRLIKMGATLYDLSVACLRKSDGQELFLTVGEWQNLTVEQRGKLARRGLRIRAYGDSFILAPDKYPGKSWGDAFAIATAYKACTAETDGVQDPGAWTLPSLREAQTLYMHREEINEALTAVWSADMNLSDTFHWTSAANGGQYFMVSVASGAFYSAAVSSEFIGRPVCNQTLN